MHYRGKILGKLNFSEVDAVYGLELCLSVAGLDAVAVSKTTALACDVLLVSLCWYRDVIELAKTVGRASVRSGCVVIAGGIQATQTPEIVAQYADFVFIGDGEEDLRSIVDDVIDGKRPRSEYVYADGDASIPAPKKLPPRPFLLKRKKNSAALYKAKGNWAKFAGDDTDKKTTYRIEVARGCHYKCAHCELSALKSYCEVPADDIERMLDHIPRGAHVGVFAPERTAHSEWGRISGAITDRGLQDWGADTRLEKMAEVPRYTAFIGLDGLSRKMRRSVGKGYSDGFIMGRLKEFISTGQRRVSGGMVVVYYICDLPGEAEEDWSELTDFYGRLSSEDWSRNLRIRPLLNPLSPKKHTRLADTIIHPLEPYPSRWGRFLRGGDGASRWGVRVFETRTWGPLERVLDLVVERGGKAGAEVIDRLSTRHLKRPDGFQSDLLAREVLSSASSAGLDASVLGYKV